jgi:chemotaxis protein MotB
LKKKTQLPPLSRPSSKRHEEHTHHEAWAIPYGDLLTLLLAFFVVMYALSSVNEGKYRVLSTSLRVAFQGEAHKPEPVQVGKEPAAAGAAQLSSPAANPTGDVPAPQPASEAAPSASLTPELDNSLANVAGQVESAMADLVQQNLLVVRRTDQGVEVEIKTDILFPSGSAQLAPSAVSVLERLAQVLGPLPNAVRVEGHTDNVPIRNAQFYSNWELSAARAGSVVRVLSGRGVAPNRLAVVGFGEQRPKEGNDTSQGRNANRRVVVVIMSVDRTRANDPWGTLAHPPAPSVPASPADAAPQQPAANTLGPRPAPAPTSNRPPVASIIDRPIGVT